MNFKFNNSIIFKLSLALGIVSASILLIFILFVSIKTRQDAIESAERTALAESHECAKQVQLELNKAIVANRMLCQTIGSVNDQHPDDLSRDAVNTILKNTLETFPDLFGVYTVWEPNAFDNKDLEYSKSKKSKAGHDTTGRLIPLWYRSTGGEIKLVPIDGYANEQNSAWYFMPQKSGKETVLDPFYYKNMYMISVVNPILKNERFLGITGISMKMSFVQKMVDEFDVYNKKGDITILSDAGTIVAASNAPKLAGKPIPVEYKIPASIFSDSKEFVSFHQGTLRAFVPFKLGDSEKTWVAMIQIPNSELMASSNNLILILLVSGLLTIALLLVGIYFFASRLTQPIQTLADMAEEMANGNTPELVGFTSNIAEVEKLHGSLDKILSVHKEIKEASLEDKKRTSETSELLEQTKKQSEKQVEVTKAREQEMEQLKISHAQMLQAQDEKMRKNIEELQVKQTEITKSHEEALRKNTEHYQAIQAKALNAHEEKVTKNLEELQFAKLELQSTKVDMARKEQTYLAEIEKLKLGLQTEVLVKKSTFSKFVIPVEIKK